MNRLWWREGSIRTERGQAGGYRIQWWAVVRGGGRAEALVLLSGQFQERLRSHTVQLDLPHLSQAVARLVKWLSRGPSVGPSDLEGRGQLQTLAWLDRSPAHSIAAPLPLSTRLAAVSS
jgi:hypothetical protein